MNRKQFTFYNSYFRAICLVRNKAVRADIYDSICRYALWGQEPEWEKLHDSAIMALELIIPGLEASRRKSEIMLKCAPDTDEDCIASGGSSPETLHKGKGEDEVKDKVKGKDKLKTKTEDKGKCGGVPLAIKEQDFEIFWEAYPKKAGRQRAKQAFLGVQVSLRKLLDALEDQKKSPQWKRNGGRFIPHAATWLSECRWEDELGGEIISGPVGVVPSGHLGEAERAAIARVMAEGG